MQKKLSFALGLFFVVVNAGQAVPIPTNDTYYSGAMKMTNEKAAPANWRRDLAADTQEACRTIHRSLYLVENKMAKLKLAYVHGYNFAVLFKNPEFYHKALARRYAACTKGGVPFYKYGRCGTQQETLAFVKVTLGFVHSTINLCDEYFARNSGARRDVAVHEFGRLENIGDDPNATTNNIYIWDAITSAMGEAKNFAEMAKP